ncbi:hypothetical protein NFI96_018733, partial [Prochilodus magdalenae]
ASEWKYKVGVSNKVASEWKYKVGVSNKVASEWKHKVGVSNKVASEWKYRVGVSNKVASEWKHKVGGSNKVASEWKHKVGVSNKVASEWKYKVGVSNKVASEWKHKVGVSTKVASVWKYKVGVSNKVASEWKHKVGVSNKVASEWKYRVGVSNKVASVWKYKVGVSNKVDSVWKYKVGVSNKVDSEWKRKVGVSNKVASEWKYKVGVSNKVASEWKYKVGVSNKVASEWKHKVGVSTKVARCPLLSACAACNGQDSPVLTNRHLVSLLHFPGLPLALCALSLVRPAPIQDPWKDMQDPEFQEAVENAHSLISKILLDIPEVHKSWITSESLSLDRNDSTKLQYLKEVLNLPVAPALKPLSVNFTLDACLSQIVEGLRLHQTLLEVVSNLRRTKSASLDGLLYDIRDLLVHIRKMQSLKSMTSSPETQTVQKSQLQEALAPHLSDDYTSQVAAHLALLQLRDFARDVYRSLRSMTLPDPDSQTTLGWN